MLDDARDLALVFAGDDAVGAYHAGTYEALHGSGLRPDWVVGASIGAVTAAIVAGNAPEDRVAKLRTFWDEATQGSVRGRGVNSRTALAGIGVAIGPCG